MEEGEIEVDSIEPIGFPDITPQLARESGFPGVIDSLKVAKYGKGERIYLSPVSLRDSTQAARKSCIVEQV